jgi:hypothetical protein
MPPRSLGAYTSTLSRALKSRSMTAGVGCSQLGYTRAHSIHILTLKSSKSAHV